MGDSEDLVEASGVGCSVFRNWRNVNVICNPSSLPANSEKPNTRPLFEPHNLLSVFAVDDRSEPFAGQAGRCVEVPGVTGIRAGDQLQMQMTV